MAKALITGSEGFVAEYLTRYLVGQKIEVYGFDMRAGQDLRDYEQIRTAIDQVQPDYIYHLAAQTYNRESLDNPFRTFDVNTRGSLNLLEAVRQTGTRSKILLASTSEVYGYNSQEGKVTESSPTRPESPYGVSKLAMEDLGRYYHRKHGMNIVITRAFNHTGPGRNAMFADSAFAKQIAEVEKGRKLFVSHGDLGSVRNYTDVRDVVRAYAIAIEALPDTYNVCSTTNVSMQKIMDVLIANSTGEIRTRLQEGLGSPPNTVFHKPSYDKLAKLGWQPTIELGDTLNDLLNSWRAKI